MPFCATVWCHWNTTATNIQHWWEQGVGGGGGWGGGTELLHWGFFFFSPQSTSTPPSARQIKLSDNRLHQKSPEREELAKENQYIIERLAAPVVPARRSRPPELLTSFLLQDLYLLFPHSSFCSSSPDNLLDPHHALEWTHLLFFGFNHFPAWCLFVCLLCGQVKQRQEDWLVTVTRVHVTGFFFPFFFFFKKKVWLGCHSRLR